MHVLIALERDEDGYPPVDAEELDAVDLGGGRFELVSAPAFAYGIAPGDVLRAEEREDGIWAVEVVCSSANWLARVIPRAGASTAPAAAEFGRLGCITRESPFGLVTVVVPPKVPALPILRRLYEGQDDSEEWYFDLGVAPELG
ncbi:DUF4265 domain-containing protein [Nocardioides sp.]|uniref:DUF4265 domain-containing protein n=1 Tax=Nocardioides sp. TaxID=35761 RepID=UPI002CA3FCFC|nr:DUF4265 domain-containing protein [Nocardioides sp.]HSX68933.1 DUF4265 domain-containing protein [Nocardioides sp.]